MAVDREKFYRLYKKYVLESLTELLQTQLEKECAVGTGKLWKYISDLVVSGVYSHVYDVYKPKVYQRRAKNGGLADPRNVIVTVGQCSITETDGEAPIEILNTTMPGLGDGGGDFIADDIIAGTGYRFAHYDRRKQFSRPRNFYETYDEEYDEEYAGNIILQAIIGKYQELVNNAYTKALAASTK